MQLFPVVTFCCYLGIIDDTRSEAAVFQRALFFVFPAVTVVFCGGCLAFLEYFSLMFLDYGLCVVCVAITNLYVVFGEILLYR